MPTSHLARPALFWGLTAALAASLLSSHPAAAQTPAIEFPTSATGAEDTAANTLKDPNGSYSLGFEFTSNTPALVTALGYFNDPAFDPTTPTFAVPHTVGLYQVVAGVTSLLTSTAVTSADTSNGDFLYHSLAFPVTLIPGGDYVLAGVSGPTDPYFFDVQDSNGDPAITVDPAITFVKNRSTVSSALAFPTDTDINSGAGFFGPNMLLGSAPVPEASTTISLGLMLALGLAGLGLSARRRSSRSH